MPSLRRIAPLALVLAAGLAALPARAEDKVLARIDGQPITETDVAQMSASMAALLAQIPEDMRKRSVLDRVIDMRLIAAAALARTESRGGHFRADFPVPDPAQARRTFLTLAEARAISARSAEPRAAS